MKYTSPKKKQETLILVVLGLLLAIVLLISKFVIGINFSLMEQGGYISIGYHEVHGAQIWALEFESFTGSISYDASLPENAQRRLLVYSGTGSSNLTLSVESGRERSEYILQGDPLDVPIPGDKDMFKLTLSGTEVLSGYFSAVWE